jgi:hypothetical protein
MRDQIASHEVRSLRVETSDSQASTLQLRIAELDAAIEYQEEQHGPQLIVCLQFKRGHENAVFRILEDLGLRAGRKQEESEDAS